MSSPQSLKSRDRTLTTAKSPSGPSAPNHAVAGSPQGAKPRGTKICIHPEPRLNLRPCSCDQQYLRTRFCLPGGPPMNFHERFFACVTCGRRPALYLCCKCWKGYCKQHSHDHHTTIPEHHIYCNYEVWQYEECFSCFKCGGFTICEAFDNVLEPLFMSKGSFVPIPVTDKHTSYHEDHGIRVGAGTMQGWRADNEDSHVVYLGLPISTFDYFAVYDGHGGPLVSRFAGRKTHEIFDALCKTGGDVAALLTKAFLLTDDSLTRETSPEESGSCGCTANVVVVNHQAKKIYCANAGDARAVLSRGGKAINLSEDHRPTVDSERARVLAAGSAVSDDGRVEGLLAVSRAFGDFDFKQATTLPVHKQAVTCMPEVSTNNLTPEDHFIITACDGIWDVVTSQEAVSFVTTELRNSNNDPQVVAGKLLDRCVARELPEDGLGTDNMSIVLVLLK